MATTSFLSEVNYVVEQTDKTLVVGVRGETQKDDVIEIIRLDREGNIDTSFGVNGHLLLSEDYNVHAVDVEVAEDGSFYVLQALRYEYGRIKLAKFTRDGQLDTSFAQDGWLTFTDEDEKVYDLTIANDKLLLSGSHDVTEQAILWIYGAQGQVVNDFGTDGQLILQSPGGGGDHRAYLSAVQGNHLLVALRSFVGVTDKTDTYVVRIDLQGTLDTSFNNNTGHIRVFYEQGAVELLNQIKVEDDQSFWLVSNNSSPMVLRYTANGQTDTSFANNGELRLATYVTFIGATFGRDGINIVYENRNDNVVRVYNFSNAGDINLDYGVGGLFRFYPVQKIDINSAQLVHERLWVVGHGEFGNAFINEFNQTENHQVWWATQLYPHHDIDGDGVNNRDDADVDGDGISDNVEFQYGTDPLDPTDFPQDQDSDGIFDLDDNCPTRFNTGQEDSDADTVGDACDAFPNDATETTDTDGDGIGNNTDTDDDNDGISDDDEAQMGLDPLDALDGFSDLDGDLVILTDELTQGTDPNNSNDVISPLSETFGDNGVVRVAIDDNTSEEEYGNGITPLANGQFLLSGYAAFNGDDHLFIARFNADGSQDLSFGDQGYFKSEDIDYDGFAAVLNDGSIIGYDDYGRFTKLSSDGILDTGFGTNGLLDFGGSRDAGVVINYDDNSLLFGYKKNDNAMVTKTDLQGNIDNAFGTNGTAEIDLGGSDEIAAVFPQQDGTIVVAASANDTAYLYKLDATGTVATSFANNGIFTYLSDRYQHEFMHSKVRQAQQLANGNFALLINNSINELKRFELLQVTPVGAIDTNWADNGVVDLESGHSRVAEQYELTDFVELENQQLLLMGSIYTDRLHRRIISAIRLNADGSKDLGYFNQGVARARLNEDVTIYGNGVIKNNDILFAGYIDETTSELYLVGLKNAIVVPDNNPPTFVESSPKSVIVDEDGTPIAFSLTLNVTDLDNDLISWSISEAAENGVANADGQGSTKVITYQPVANFHGVDSFTVQVSDGRGGMAEMQVNVSVNSINDPATGSISIYRNDRDYPNPFEGQSLTTDGNFIDDVDGLGELTYIWRREGTEVAQGEVYYPSMDDIGFTLTVEAQFTDGDGFNEIVISSATPTVIVKPHGDYDDDGLTNDEENALGTDFENADSDGDGVDDSHDFYPQVALGGLVDSDGDGIPDVCDVNCQALGMEADVYPLGIIYVNDDSTCDALNAICGRDWQTAFPYLQDALLHATANTQIWIAEGVYYPDDNQQGDLQGDVTARLTLKQSVRIYGGFSDELTATQIEEADPENSITVISADIDRNDVLDDKGITASYLDVVGANANSLFSDSTHMNHFEIHGLTLTGVQGANSTDAAISISHAGASLNHLRAFGNTSDKGAVLAIQDNDNCRITVSNVLATNNSTSAGAIIGSYDSACERTQFTRITLRENHGYEGAFYIDDATGSATFNKVMVLNELRDDTNYASAIKSSIESFRGSLRIEDSTFSQVGGIDHDYSSLSIANSTFSQTNNPIYFSVDEGEDVEISYTTFIDNFSVDDRYSAGIHARSGDLSLEANLFVNNRSSVADNLYLYNNVALEDDGYNLMSELNSGNGGVVHQDGLSFNALFSSGTSVVNSDSMASIFSGQLADNGDDLLTVMINQGGAAADVIPTEQCMFTEDQRDNYRGFNNGCDIGAIEIVATDIVDTDGDELGDNIDPDDDNDGFNDNVDEFPLDATEWLDTDGDGIGNNADTDDDNDGFNDNVDEFPLDVTEWLDTDGDGIGNNADTDDDNDGFNDDVDDFPLDATEWLDTDGDGIGNNADADDDNDGFNDNVDEFPLDATEWLDTDGDGIGNNADTDDDNDGIPDNEDSDPLVPNDPNDEQPVDTEAPVFGEVNTVTIEATGILTAVQLSAPPVTDNLDDDVEVSHNADDELSIGQHSVIWTARDDADNEATAVQLVILTDTTAPTFEDLDVLTIEARGLYTDISDDVNVFATDAVSGQVPAEILSDTLLMAGKHFVELIAADNAGNEAIGQLEVHIVPSISIAASAIATSDSELAISYQLSGKPALFPVDIQYQLLRNGEVIEEYSQSITDGVQGTLTVLISEAEAQDDVSIQLSAVSNAVIGESSTTSITIVDENLSPTLEFQTTQNNRLVSVIDINGGRVDISAMVSDINDEDEHQVTWDADAGLPLSVDNHLASFEPSGLEVGQYDIDITVTETNTEQQLSTSYTLVMVLVNAVDLASDEDSDNDGVSDFEEGASDSDRDGIADYLDTDENTSRLPSSEDTAPIATESGYTLSLGTFVKAVNGLASDSAGLTVEELASIVGEGAADPFDHNFAAMTPIYNFVIADLTQQGQSVSVVLPLAQDTEIPENSVFRKYNETQGWYTFVQDENNALMSALKDSDGNCPAASDSAYTLGLTAGNECIQLVIEDGGPNDADMNMNASIEDPGVLAVDNSHLAPQINLEAVYNMEERSQLVIDASTAVVAQGEDLSYQWELVSHINGSLEDDSTEAVTIIAGELDETTEYELLLTVVDGSLVSTEQVTVVVEQVNRLPTVTIESHASELDENTSITITATAEDADLDEVSYRWQQTAGPDLGVAGQTQSSIVLSLPEVNQNQQIGLALYVSDGQGESQVTTSFDIINIDDDSTDDQQSSSGGSLNIYLLWLLLCLQMKRYTNRHYYSGNRID